MDFLVLYASIALESETSIFAKWLLLGKHWYLTHELSGTQDNADYGKAYKGLT